MRLAWRRNVLVGLALLPLIVFGTTFAQVEKVPSAELLTWLRENAHPLQSAVPIEDDEDLEPLRTIVGDARIVALGEATHGTSEFFTIKHRIVQFLAEEMNFTIFSIEANMPEAYRMNEYVLTGEGDPRELLDGMYFWTWNTQEVLDMVLWMREYNASGQGVMQFTGFDMQTPTVAMEEVRAFVAKHDPDYLVTLDEAYDTVTKARKDSREVRPKSIEEIETSRSAWRSEAERVFNDLTERQSTYKNTSASDIAWAIQNARLIVQSMNKDMNEERSVRDPSMAANIEWILEQNPKAKAVLWAHNGHIKEKSLPYNSSVVMGNVLADRYGEDYLSIGFSFYSGQYTAVRSGEGLGTQVAEPASTGSIGSVFHTLDLPLFLLDVRAARRDARASWLVRPHEMRQIGAVAPRDGQTFSQIVLTDDYDAIIFVDQMTPTDLLQ